MLGSTDEYAALKGLESVLLYDKVTVIDEEIGLDVSLEVTEMEWDAVSERVVSIKVSNASMNNLRNVTGYNVQNKSIGLNKLSDDVMNEVMGQVTGIVPEYADPDAARPSSNISVIDNLTSTSTTDALSANQGRVLNNRTTYWTLLTGVSLTSSYVTESTYNSRKLSDYGMLVFSVSMSGWIRASIVIPRSVFNSNSGCALVFHDGSNIIEADIKPKSDTSFDVKYIGNPSATVVMYAYGIF